MARLFDASDDYFIATSSPVTALPITLAIWGKSSVDSAQGLLGLWNSASNNRIQLAFNGSGSGNPAYAGSVNTSGSFEFDEEGTGFDDGAWHHVGGVFSSSTLRRCYFDGVNTGSSTATSDCSPSSFNRVFLGGRTGASANGTLAEAAIWSVALSADEMATLAAGYSPLLVRPQSLVFYAPLFGRAGASGDEEDWIGGRTLGQFGSPALYDHPRIIYPRRQIFVPYATASAAASLILPLPLRAMQHLLVR